MSKSAFASLPNRVNAEAESTSIRVPSPAASLGKNNNNNQKNYITAAVGMQERKQKNLNKFNNNFNRYFFF